MLAMLGKEKAEGEWRILDGLDCTLLCDSIMILVGWGDTCLCVEALFPPIITGLLSEAYRDATVFDSE